MIHDYLETKEKQELHKSPILFIEEPQHEWQVLRFPAKAKS